MQHVKRTAQKTPIRYSTGLLVAETRKNASAAKGRTTPRRVWKISLRYHLGLSKQTMSVTRYRLSGSTQRKGMAATSWQIRLVVARSMRDGIAAMRYQMIRAPPGGCAADPGSAAKNCGSIVRAAGVSFLIPNAHQADPATKIA